MIQYPRYRQHRFSSFQVIIAGFAAVDLVGALLLMLPIAAQQRCVTPFHEALFTSTSALCVTGLVVQDTGSYWSAFGQSVILLLIQIGGLGVITVGAAFAPVSYTHLALQSLYHSNCAVSYIFQSTLQNKGVALQRQKFRFPATVHKQP